MRFVVLLVTFLLVCKIEGNRFYSLLAENPWKNYSYFNTSSLAHFLQTFLADEPISVLHVGEDLATSMEVFKLIHLPISIIDLKRRYVFFEGKVDVTSNYIMFLEPESVENTLENLELGITSFKALITWNRDAKYLIIVECSFLVTPTMKLLWKYRIYNMVVATIEDQSFYTWYPYEVQSNCGDFVRPHRIDLFKSLNPFENKVPKNLNGCPFTLGWIKSEYMMHDPADAIPGAGNQFFATFTRIRNLTMVYKYKLIYHLEAINYITTTFDLDLKNKETDMYSFTMIRMLTYTNYDLSEILFEQRLFWILPQPTRVPLWKCMMVVFKTEVWVALLVTLTLTSAIWWTFGYVLPKHQNIKMSTMTICRIFLGVSLTKLPKAFTQRILITFSNFVPLTIIVVYIGMMSSFLTNPSYEPILTNIEQIAKTNLKLKFYDLYVEKLLEVVDEETGELIVRNHVSTTLMPHDLLQDFLRNPTFVATTTDLQLSNKLRNPSVIEKVYEKSWEPWGLRLMLAKGHPFTHRLNHMVRLSHEAGLFTKWIQNSCLKSEKLEIAVEVAREHSLTTKDLRLGLCVLIIGLAMSSVVFTLELAN